MKMPIKWTDEQLSLDAKTAEGLFRTGRLDITDAWAAHYKEARAKFELLFAKLGDLHPDKVTEEALAVVYGEKLGEQLRYLAGPPISDDDLKVIADVTSLAPNVLARSPAKVKKVFAVLEKVIDPHRFPWVSEKVAPTAAQREAALLASAVLLAAQRIATERRSDGKSEQEQKVKDYLLTLGFVEVPTETITTIVKGPGPNQFCAECKLSERKADVVVRLHDTRLMPIECKVSNSATNSVKRLNNDAAVKAKFWVGKFGSDQVVPAAMLAGVFKVLNLKQAQGSQLDHEGKLSLFWSHDLDKLGEFIASTKD